MQEADKNSSKMPAGKEEKEQEVREGDPADGGHRIEVNNVISSKKTPPNSEKPAAKPHPPHVMFINNNIGGNVPRQMRFYGNVHLRIGNGIGNQPAASSGEPGQGHHNDETKASGNDKEHSADKNSRKMPAGKEEKKQELREGDPVDVGHRIEVNNVISSKKTPPNSNKPAAKLHSPHVMLINNNSGYVGQQIFLHGNVHLTIGNGIGNQHAASSGEPGHGHHNDETKTSGTDKEHSPETGNQQQQAASPGNKE